MRKNSSAYLEMLFENRNKAYGAYDLRVNYENRLIKSFGMALLIAALFFLIPYILTKIITRRLEVKSVLTHSTIYLQQDLVFEKRKPAVMASRQLKTLPAESYRIVKKEEIQKQDINKPVDPD